MTLELELKALFGEETLQQSKQVSHQITSAQAESISTTAGVLFAANDPRQQRELVQALPEQERYLLCRWLSDKEYINGFNK
jgi:hypothetical protein